MMKKIFNAKVQRSEEVMVVVKHLRTLAFLRFIDFLFFMKDLWATRINHLHGSRRFLTFAVQRAEHTP